MRYIYIYIMIYVYILWYIYIWWYANIWAIWLVTFGNQGCSTWVLSNIIRSIAVLEIFSSRNFQPDFCLRWRGKTTSGCRRKIHEYTGKPNHQIQPRKLVTTVNSIFLLPYHHRLAGVSGVSGVWSAPGGWRVVCNYRKKRFFTPEILRDFE